MEAEEFEIQILGSTEGKTEYVHPQYLLDCNTDVSAINFATALWGGDSFVKIVQRDILSNINLN